MGIIKGIIRIIIATLIGLIGFKGLHEEFYSDKQKVKMYEQLKLNGKETIAIFDSIYTETTIKIKRAKIKLYKIDYTFFVNKNKYSGEHYFKHPDSLKYNIRKVKYLENNPNINAIDIERKLDNAKEDENSNVGLWFSIPFSIISLLLLISGIKKIVIPNRKIVNHKKTEKVIIESEPGKTQTENVTISKEDKEDPSRFMPK